MIVLITSWIDVLWSLSEIALVIAGIKELSSHKTVSASSYTFGFGLLCFFLSDVYSQLYCLLKNAYRVPHFSPGDIGALGYLLLFGSYLRMKYKGNEEKSPLPWLFALYAVSNSYLWYYWSGNLMSSVSGAVGVFYFCYALGCALLEVYPQRTVRLRWLWIGLPVLAMELLIRVTDGILYMILNGLCYGIFFAVSVYLILKCIEELRDGEPGRLVAMCYGLLSWTLMCLYLSTDAAYAFMDACVPVALVLLFIAVKKEAESK